MLKDPSLEGLFFFQKHPIRMPTVWGTGDGGGVLEHPLVHEREACQGDHRELAVGLQRGQAPQLTERQNAKGIH